VTWQIGDPPTPVSDLEIVEPKRPDRLMPHHIPGAFESPTNPWRQFVTTWLRHGLHPSTKLVSIKPVPAQAAFRHLKALGRSDVDRARKQAAMAYLASQWFVWIYYARPEGADWLLVGDMVAYQRAQEEDSNDRDQ
jgi:hypothetical protein